jgi:hypothetical protein
MIAANNHYAGFGPGTVNIFRKMVGLSEISWTYEGPQERTDASNFRRFLNTHDREQSRLTDFLE